MYNDVIGIFFFSSRRRHTRSLRDWSSDVCSSDLGMTHWPGRFQLIRHSPAVIVDGAHNPAGALALAASLKSYFPNHRVTFVVGTSEDKDKAGILDALLPLARRVIFAAADHP